MGNVPSGSNTDSEEEDNDILEVYCYELLQKCLINQYGMSMTPTQFFASGSGCILCSLRLFLRSYGLNVLRPASE